MDTILVPRARGTPDKKQKYLIFGRPFHRMLDASCAKLPLPVVLLKAITPVSGGGPPTVGPGRFTYCYTPLGLRKGASPHRCRHGTVRKEGSNPRQIITTEELMCPARLAKPGRAACVPGCSSCCYL